MTAPTDISIPGLILAGIVAIAAWMLWQWERVRPRWPRPGALDRLSDRLRYLGIFLMWLESFLMALGSQLPTRAKSDRLLFISIWAIVGIGAILLVTFAIADSIVRLMAHRVRATAVSQVWESMNPDCSQSEPNTRIEIDDQDETFE